MRQIMGEHISSSPHLKGMTVSFNFTGNTVVICGCIIHMEFIATDGVTLRNSSCGNTPAIWGGKASAQDNSLYERHLDEMNTHYGRQNAYLGHHSVNAIQMTSLKALSYIRSFAGLKWRYAIENIKKFFCSSPVFADDIYRISCITARFNNQ